MGTGGGAATNTGIDFQQRLASFFMIHMLMDIHSLRGIGIEGEFVISEISFEASEDVDDIVLTTNSGTLFFQAKRNISLSDKANSEFQKTINQFIAQHLKDDNSSDRYILATTSIASSKIRQELRKITESIRLNDINFEKNPLSKSEKFVFSKIKTCICKYYEKASECKISDDVIFSILRKIYIVVADIQQGSPLEGAVLTLLASKSRVNPELVWSASITVAISLASKRQSINKYGLENKLGHLFRKQTPKEKKEIEREFFNIQYSNGGISSGKDVLLIESFVEDCDLLIVELIRFDETGEKN
jgi:hypothetical protein